MNRSWLILNPKIKAALATMLVADAAAAAGALNGTISWHVMLGGAIVGALTTLAGYLTPAPVVAAAKAAAAKVRGSGQ